MSDDDCAAAPDHTQVTLEDLADSATIDALEDLDWFSQVELLEGLEAFEGLNLLEIKDLIEAHFAEPFEGEQPERSKKIRAQARWTDDRIVRFLSRYLATGGEYRVRFEGRMPHQRLKRIAARMNSDIDPRAGGVWLDYYDRHDDRPRFGLGMVSTSPRA